MGQKILRWEGHQMGQRILRGNDYGKGIRWDKGSEEGGCQLGKGWHGGEGILFVNPL
jgi:hypothetical protein